MAVEDVCRQLFEKYNSTVEIVNIVKTEALSKYNSLKSSIEGLIEIPQNTLDDMLSDLGNINVSAPTTLSSAEKQVLKCLMSALGIEDTSSIDQANDWTNIPAKWAKKYLQSLQLDFKNGIFNILDTNVLGQAGDLLSKFDDYIHAGGIGNLLSQLDSLLACLNAGCTAFYPGVPDYAGDIRDELNLDSSNKFKTGIFSTWNGDAGVISQLNQITEPIRGLDDSIRTLSF